MILMYHNVDQEAGFNTVSLDNFLSQLVLLQSLSDLEVVSLDDYVSALGKPRKKFPVVLTFDDAYQQAFRQAVPVLEKCHMPATVFVPVEHVGGYNTWDSGISVPRLDIVDWPELKAWSRHPLLTIGSHGMSHLSFGTLNPEQAAWELSESRRLLQENLEQPIGYFAYPYGQQKDLGPFPKNLIREAGYRAALTTNWSRRNSPANVLGLNRMEIRPQDGARELKEMLSAKIDLRRIRQQLKNTLTKWGLKK